MTKSWVIVVLELLVYHCSLHSQAAQEGLDEWVYPE